MVNLISRVAMFIFFFCCEPPMCITTCPGLYLFFIHRFHPSIIFFYNSWTSCQFIVGPHGMAKSQHASCVGLWGGDDDIAICSSPSSGQEGKEQSVSDQCPSVSSFTVSKKRVSDGKKIQLLPPPDKYMHRVIEIESTVYSWMYCTKFKLDLWKNQNKNLGCHWTISAVSHHWKHTGLLGNCGR